MAPRRRIVACLIAGALASVAAVADSVFLKNGQSFEGVEATVSGDHVTIELPIGSMRLALAQVERIDESDSALGEYRAREARLQREGAGADAWLELAQWARTAEFERGMEKAALVAARLDPELEGLDPVMAALDYVFEEMAGEWVPYADSMRRQGLVEDRGEWITPEEMRARSDAGTAAADGSRSRTDDHLDKALDIIAEAVGKPEAPHNTTVIVQQPGFGGFGFFPGFTPGAFIAPPVLHDPGIGSVLPFSLSGTFFTGDAKITRSTTWDQMTLRQPGSFIPATPRFFR